MALDLVGIAEIARQDPAFPHPVAELAAGRIWLRPEVTEWARRAGRLE